jgi:glutathione S-transferase
MDTSEIFKEMRDNAMTALPNLLSAVVTVLTVVLYFAMSLNVGRLRMKHGIKAPATGGHPEFDCAFRVQMNTLERLPVFLPLLWLATAYFTPLPAAAAALGLVWIVGRVLYMKGYMEAPEKRGLGFGVSALAELLLLLLTAAGIGIGFAG